MDLSRDLIDSGVLSALQLRTGNDTLLPRLWSFECKGATEAFIPFIPLFLTHKIAHVHVAFAVNSPVVVASTIARLWTWCPNIQRITLNQLPESPVVTEALSEMVLACNRDTLLSFLVNSPLTVEAREVLYNLPKLRHLWAVLQGPTPPPQIALSNLATIRLQFDDGSSWPPLFHGANLRGLESVKFVPSQSAQINGFLEEFKKVAGSFQNTLSEFYFRTSQSWNPSYASLLEFRKLKILEIEFSCHNRCSSQVGDDVVLSIAEAMPRLEILRLGQATCSNPTGATVKSLAALAHYCPQLSKLRIHLRLGESARTEQTPSPKRAVAIPQADCALTELEVGEASVPSGTSGKLAVALTLAQLFPQLNNIHYVNPQWKFVQETVTLSKVMGNRIHDISKIRFPHSRLPLLNPRKEARWRRNPPNDSVW